MNRGSSLTLANKITILRILGIPVFILLLIYYILGLKRGEANASLRAWALAVFLMVALTDAVDGYFARYRNEVTKLGRMLDPLADKALLLSALILMTRPSLSELHPQFPVGFTLLVISRDAVLVVGAILIHAVTGRVEVQPRIAGKLSTSLQMIAIVWALAAGPEFIFVMLVWMAGIFTFISAGQYLFDGFRQLEKTPEP